MLTAPTDEGVRAHRGPWFQTYRGVMFHITNPSADELLFDDIAHALAYQCRFNGHTTAFYSIAQHSVLVARCLSEQFGETHVAWLRTALFHDSAEAYMGDMVRPLKITDAHFRRVEAQLEEVIAQRFNLLFPMPYLIKRADNAVLLAERNALMSPPPRPWSQTEEPYAGLDTYWPPETAEAIFRAAAREYLAPV